MKNLNHKFLKTALFIAVAVCTNQYVSAAVVPIANGDFDSPGSSFFNGSNPNAIVGWTVTNFGSGDIGVVAATDNGFPAADGNSLFLYQGADASPLVLSQTLTGNSLIAGATYNLTLDVGKRFTGTAETLTVNFYAGATELAWTSTGTNLTPSGPASPQAWSFTYVAPATVATGDLRIELVGAGSGNNSDWIAADNVKLTESSVPEPSTYALMLGGLGFMALLMRRKNARS